MGKDVRRTLGVGKGDIGGDFVVFINGNPVARCVDFCALDLNRFLREGDNSLHVKGTAANPFEVVIGASRQLSDRYTTDDIVRTYVQPMAGNRVDMSMPFQVKRAAQVPVLACPIPADHEAVEGQLRGWLEGINDLIRAGEYAKVYEAVFTYHDTWYVDHRGWTPEDAKESHIRRLAEDPSFKMFPVDLAKVRFVFGPNLVLAYDASLHDDNLSLQGVIMVESAGGTLNSIIDYLRFAYVDGEWKVW